MTHRKYVKEKSDARASTFTKDRVNVWETSWTYTQWYEGI